MTPKSNTAVRVLVADDDEIFQEILAETVEEAGAVVELAPDGVAALEQLSAGDFDILVSDLNMPRMDGLTLLKQVRTLYPHILCILITGFGSLESAIQALRLGAYDYIQKPFMVEQVAVTIRNSVERVNNYKERADLLREIDNLHEKIYLLQGKRYSGVQGLRQLRQSDERTATAESARTSARCFSGKTTGQSEQGDRGPRGAEGSQAGRHYLRFGTRQTQTAYH